MTSPSNNPKVARLQKIVFPAVGAGFAIAALGLFGDLGHLPFLVPPLGASATLVWMVPASPLAQPRAVIGGSLVSATIGFAIVHFLGNDFWALGLAVAAAILAMSALSMLHAPAGALPLLIGTVHFEPTVFLPILLVATIILVGLGVLYHRLVGAQSYPATWW